MHKIRAWFFSLLVEPLLKGVRDQVCDFIVDSDYCIDIGCGIGALAFDLSEKSERVVGVELSAERVGVAEQRRKREAYHNVVFSCVDATDLARFGDGYFDYATISLLLHSVPSETAVKILREATRVAKKLVIAEFVVPQPRSFYDAIIKALEAYAGREHFQSFVSYKKKGGIDQLLDQAGLQVEERVIRPSETIQVLVVSAS